LRQAGFNRIGSWSKVTDPDQWTLTGMNFKAHAPLYRVRVGKGQTKLAYVSSRTGEIVQFASLSDRVWGYLGPVIHWIYPTILRKRVALWDTTVVYLSALGTILCLLGILVGLIFFR
ncbi:MAG: PepSY domain-containing protein, partial [bacterium]